MGKSLIACATKFEKVSDLFLQSFSAATRSFSQSTVSFIRILQEFLTVYSSIYDNFTVFNAAYLDSPASIDQSRSVFPVAPDVPTSSDNDGQPFARLLSHSIDHTSQSVYDPSIKVIHYEWNNL